MKKLLNQSFFAGLLVVLPVATTLWLVFGILELTDNLLHKFLPQQVLPFNIPGLGFVATIFFILLIGFIARNFLGRFLFFWVERGFSAIPVVNRIYTTVKQVLETLFKSKGDQFNAVVMVEFPKDGAWAVGFITSDVPKAVGEGYPGDASKVQFVFVPTAPNPTSGFLMALPPEKIRAVNMTVEDAFKLIISGGIVHPDELDQNNLQQP